jgi:hypothetical protein
MSCNRFNLNNRSASVSGANGFGANQQDTGTKKTLTTYFGLLYVGFRTSTQPTNYDFFNWGSDIIEQYLRQNFTLWVGISPRIPWDSYGKIHSPKSRQGLMGLISKIYRL